MPQHYTNLKLSLGLLLTIWACISAIGQTHQTEFWQTDGLVKDAVAHQNRIYLGGEFGYLGANTGPIGLVDTVTGATLPLNWPRFEGPIYDIETDGRGGWFVAGAFIKIGNSTAIKFLARVLPNGTIDTQFNPNPNLPVYALHRSGNTLYVGGGFSAIYNGQVRQYLCAINTTNLTLRSWAPNPNLPVYALESYNRKVIVGGKFLTISGSSRQGLAEVDSANASSVTFLSLSRPNTRWDEPTVYDIVRRDSLIYVVGAFQVASRRNAMGFNLRSGRALTWTVTTDTTISSIAFSGAKLVLGGLFRTINGQQRNHVAILDTARTPTLEPFNPDLRSTKLGPGFNVTLVEPVGDKLYVSGQFNYVGQTRKHRAARFDLTTGLLDTAWSLHNNGAVNGIFIQGTSLIAFGGFSSYNGLLVENIGVLDRTTLAGVPTSLTADSTVNALQVYQNSLFLGGLFKRLNGQSRSYMGKVMLGSEQLSAFTPVLNNAVRDFELVKNSLYVGGLFTNFMGQARPYFAKVNLLDSTLNAMTLSPNNLVNVIKYSNGRLVLGGAFSQVSGITNTAGLFVCDTLTGGRTNGYSYRNAAGGQVKTIAIDGLTAYIGGDFLTYGGTTVNRLCAVNLSSGALSTGAYPSNANNTVESLNIYGSTLYIAGRAVSFGTTSKNHVASYNLTTGAFTNWFPDVLNYCYSGIIVDRNFIVGGDFGRVDDNFRSGLLSYRLAALPFSLASFTPTTAPAGTTITLSGVGFNRVDRVTFGGQNAAAFTIVNDNTITAVLGTGNAGHVAIYAGIEKDSLAGFNLCPTTVPTWSQDTVRGCAGTNIRIAANTGYDFYLFSNGTSSTSNGTFVTASGSYTVRGVVGACTTLASAPVVVIVTPAPARPAIRFLTDSIVCANDRAVFEVRDTVPGMQYLWNAGQTTRRVSGPPNSVWSVRTVVNGCTSAVSPTNTIDLKATPPTVQDVLRAQCYGTAVTGIAPGNGNGVRFFATDTSQQTITPSVVTQNAIYYYELFNLTTGCATNRARLILTMHPRPDSNFVRIAPNTLKAVDSTTVGHIYQWIRNGRPIAGANRKSFVADSNGTYQLLIINSSGCSRLSAGLSVTIVSQASAHLAQPLLVYPNPATDQLVVTGLTGQMQAWQLINALGQVVMRGATSEEQLALNVRSLAAGQYRLLIGGQAVGVVVGR